MNIKIDTEIEIDGKNMYVIEKESYKEKEYIFVQEVGEDDLLPNYFIYEIGNPFKLIKDDTLYLILLRKFTEKLQSEL